MSYQVPPGLRNGAGSIRPVLFTWRCFVAWRLHHGFAQHQSPPPWASAAHAHRRAGLP